MKLVIHSFFLLLIIFHSLKVHATSISWLHGNTFRDDQGYESERTTMTIEHFGLWKYGNVFFYYDINDPLSGPDRQGSNQFFGGISPTFSFSKMTGKDFSFGIIRDVSLRLELENGSANGDYRFRNYFYGLQFDLALPGFDFAMINMVARDNPEQPGVGLQIGSFWQMSWEYGPWRKFKFLGFFAWSPDGNQPNQAPFNNKGEFFITQPQLLWDVGNIWGAPNSIETGFEYSYAINRFQLYKQDEKVLQWMIKFSY
jgi:nucleoside-specific outer membrane channel protein Tsx